MDTIPKKGKRYRLQSRPWDSSYLDIIEDDHGDWIFSPKREPQPDTWDELPCARTECRWWALEAEQNCGGMRPDGNPAVADCKYRVTALPED